MQNSILLLLGRKGSGKTHKTIQCMRYCPRPVFVLDSMNEFRDGLSFRSLRDLKLYLAKRRPNESGVYVLKSTSEYESVQFLDLMRWMGAEAGETGYTVVVDEVDKFCSPSIIDPSLKNLINYGRHYECHQIYAARRAAAVHSDLRSQADAIVSFQQTEPNDVNRMMQISQDASILPQLDAEKHEYIILGEWENLPYAMALDAPERRLVGVVDSGARDSDITGAGNTEFQEQTENG